MRRALVLPLFGLCAVALLGVMAWLTATVRRLDEAERRGREQAALEESVRLALWRMESLLAPLVAQENARSPLVYRARADGSAPHPVSPHVRAHVEWDAGGRISALIAPRSASDSANDAQQRQREAALLQAVASPRERESLLARLSGEWLQSFSLAEDVPPPNPKVAPVSKAPPTQNEQQQQALSEKEYQARLSNVDVLRGEVSKLAVPRPVPTTSIRFARLEPLWLGSELVMARRVLAGDRQLVQACWLDWPSLRASLLASIRDLLPAARLEPAVDGDDPTRRLAALPVKLVPGPALVAPSLSFEGERLPMGVAWGLAVLALVASGALLMGLATLGERRAAFTSAVTHELRTPLTTFRMYADMLAEGMVPEERQGEYLDTLRREAERQAHLVENVLAYSRLERGRYTAARETLTLGDLIAGLRDTLSAQAERAGMTLVLPEVGEWAEALVVADRSAVERILFNLVDNAGKYARGADDRRIHLECRVEARHALVCVRDHGPGVSPREARRLFRPFHKSARDAAQSAPGVGLGLALSRRLAKALGGDLRLESREGEGATFVLRLPRA